MEKKKFLDRIESSRTELERVLSGIPVNMMESQEMVDTWSVKDVIAHISWYEGEMVNLLSSMALKGSDLWEVDLQERNKAIHAVSSSKDLDYVIRMEKQNYLNMLALLKDLDESALNDASSFAEMPHDWQPWSVIASNTYEHYDDHVKDLKKILPTYNKN